MRPFKKKNRTKLLSYARMNSLSLMYYKIFYKFTYSKFHHLKIFNERERTDNFLIMCNT